MTSITNANLEWNDVGTPVSEQFDDVYFSNVNGLEESRYVFLKQNHLPERWHSHQQRRFIIAETGFGTGLNFLAAWQWFDKFRQENPDAKLKELHFISFEKFPLNAEDLEKAHQAWPELKEYASQLREHYPIAVPECHRLVLDEGRITLDLWFGDIKDCLPMVPTPDSGLIDAWFLDGFAPSKNPEMWSQELFDGMSKLAKQDCSCATFTAAGFVRRGLIDAGFDMKKVKGFGTKREMIAGYLAEKKPYSSIHPWYATPATQDLKEVAIIGGGIASAALAATLGRRGIPVTIYCKDDKPAMNASGNRQGALYPLLNQEHSGVSRLFAPAFLFARQFFDQSAKQFDFDHEWCGVTHLAWNESAAKKLNNILAGNFAPQLVQHLTEQQMNDTVGLPTDLEGVNYPMGGWLAPRKFTERLIDQQVQNKQLTFINKVEIESIEEDESGYWQLHSKGEIYRHQVVVIANGYAANQYKQSKAIPQSPVKGQVSHVPTTEKLKQLKTVLCYNGYITPNNPNNQYHCIGASHDRSNIDQEFDQTAQIDNVHKLQRSLPTQNWVEEIDSSDNLSRQGIRSTSRDHLPFVGQVCCFDEIEKAFETEQPPAQNEQAIAGYQNLYCLLALGGRGLCSAPLMAEVLASQICNDPLPLPVETLKDIHPGKMWIRKLIKGKPLNTVS